MTQIEYDYHTHTTFSDGYEMEGMADAAADAGLTGIGFTDHCLPYEDPFGRRDRYDLVDTFEERRERIRTLREDVEVEVFDGVELNYDPNHEDAIRAFLAAAGFDYVIGSVHYADDYYVGHPEALADASHAAKRDAVETYVDWQVRLVESGLFDVLAHPDLPQRSPALRGMMDERDYRRLADALADSETIPEINAGRLDRKYGTVHPHPDFLDAFADAGVSFVVGTDAHAPDQLRTRRDLLDPLLADYGVELAAHP